MSYLDPFHVSPRPGDKETLRDRFAMSALPAVISVCGKDTRGEGVTHSQHFAMKAYEIADAMMEARK